MKYYIVTRLVIFLTTIITIFAISLPAPSNKSLLNNWFFKNVKPFANRNMTELDQPLVDAEKNAIIIKVRADGSGNFKTLTEAINSIPDRNKRRVVIWIGGGVYKEKLTIKKTKPFITFYGSPNDIPTLTFDGDAKKYGTVDSASLIVESDYFVAANLIIENSSPKPDGKRAGAQALAARFKGNKTAIYNCKFIGFQDTLCDDTGMHLFKDCFVQGTVDFIFGKGTSLYLNTTLDVVDNGSVITAHSRELASDSSGYSFVHSTITTSSSSKGISKPAKTSSNPAKTMKDKTYLGRAWRPRSRVVFSFTLMPDFIHPEGWNDMRHPEYNTTILFGEYKCSGPGLNPNLRVKYSKQLTDLEVKPYISLGYIRSDEWLLPPPNSSLIET